MKFTVSSSLLLSRLQMVGKVISSKNTMAILDNFLLQVNGNQLTITASDLETTLTTSLEIDNQEGDITIALPAKLLMDSLKEFPEQPLCFDINPENLAVVFRTETGNYNFIGQNGNEYPKAPALKEDNFKCAIDASVLGAGVGKTAFAAATDDLRPAMTGIFFHFSSNGVTCVATDAHKLVRLINNTVTSEKEASFILPRKSANMVKNLVASEKGEVNVSFDDKNIIFEMPTYHMICRQIEGRFPNYNGVIPQNNPHEIILDRHQFISSIKRIIAFANQGTYLIKLSITSGRMTLSAQDIDFSISAQETIPCQFEGESINIGFKAPLLVDILNGISSDEVRLQLADPSRAGIILPFENEENEDMLTLLMPMLINE
jgi:DNA polymerase-3 subunit beta